MNLAHLIDDHPADHVALISQNRSVTYGALREGCARVRAALTEHGVRPGDRVGLIAGNNVSFVLGYLGIVGIGAIAAPLNPASPAPELLGELNGIGVSTVLIGPTAASGWSKLDPAEVPTLERVVALDGAQVAGALEVSGLDRPGPEAPITDVTEDTIAVLAFTSGTAGAPHAAMLSHGNLLANLEQTRRGGSTMTDADVLYGVLPCYHIFGLNVLLGMAFRVGATVVLVQRFDPATALDSIRERRVTVVPGAPPMWIAWSAMADAPADAFAGVRLALSGAAKLPEETARRFEERFGLRISEGYGLTEAGPTVTSSANVEAPRGSIGKVLPGMDVRLVDEDGVDVVAGDPGEIWVRGPNVFKGYWHDDEATARALTSDGWLRTGDIAITDDDGLLYIVNRSKDLIIVSGFNVYPAEVEDVVSEYPGVAEVAVIGVPHPHTGEAVRAYVVSEPGRWLDEESIINYCDEHLARYKCPSKVLFVDQLPKGISGKLLRRELRLA